MMSLLVYMKSKPFRDLWDILFSYYVEVLNEKSDTVIILTYWDILEYVAQGLSNDEILHTCNEFTLQDLEVTIHAFFGFYGWKETLMFSPKDVYEWVQGDKDKFFENVDEIYEGPLETIENAWKASDKYFSYKKRIL